MTRAIFDCNVLVQAMLDRGPAYRCLELLESGEVELLLSAEVLEEARAVLNRPKLTKRFPQLAPDRVAMFLGQLVRQAKLVEHIARVVTLARDPKDEPYLILRWQGRRSSWFPVTKIY
jgi:putative PIN family toxin of toxin-antitoxin system